MQEPAALIKIALEGFSALVAEVGGSPDGITLTFHASRLTGIDVGRFGRKLACGFTATVVRHVARRHRGGGRG